jgi:hypothetical protein
VTEAGNSAQSQPARPATSAANETLALLRYVEFISVAPNLECVIGLDWLAEQRDEARGWQSGRQRLGTLMIGASMHPEIFQK